MEAQYLLAAIAATMLMTTHIFGIKLSKNNKHKLYEAAGAIAWLVLLVLDSLKVLGII